MATFDDVVLSTFGARVLELRADAGLTQEELAEMSGLHRTYISQVENGARNVSLVAIAQLSAGLGVEIRDLFPS